MKQAGTILNVILLIAVAILFYLHFSGEKTTPVIQEKTDNGAKLVMEDSLTQFMELDSNITAKPIKIAYVNSDSLNKNLTMLRDVEARIEQKQKDIENKIKSQQKTFERNFKRKVDDFESKKNQFTIKAPTLTDAQLEEEQNKLMGVQQEIVQMEQKLQQRMYEFSQQQEQEYLIMKQMEMNNYYLKVQSFCKSFANTLGFDFILYFQNGGAFLHANADYDISNYVVNAINKEYSQNKSIIEESK